MSVWSSICPEGSLSVSANTPTMAANTLYTEATLNNDHFWNKGSTLDGHHQFVQTQATNDADKSVATNAPLATDMDLAFFSRFKPLIESQAQQDCQPFAIINGPIATPSPTIMQLLGIRAMAVFNGSTVTPIQSDVTYAFNIQDQPFGVVRVPQTAGTGDYQINFQTALPSANYLVIVGAYTLSGFGVFSAVKSRSSSTVYKTTTGVRVVFYPYDSTNTLIDPVQAWVCVFGG